MAKIAISHNGDNWKDMNYFSILQTFHKKVRTAEAIRTLSNSSRRLSLGGRLCYTVFSQWGLSPL